MLIAVGMACWLIQGFAFSEEPRQINITEPRNFVVDKKKMNTIVAEISASKPAPVNYPSGYSLSPDRYNTSEAKTEEKRKGWIKRHPVVFGTIVGFGSGFLIGYAAGDDGIFYDFTAGASGIILGGMGAGAGALVGKMTSH